MNGIKEYYKTYGISGMLALFWMTNFFAGIIFGMMYIFGTALMRVIF
jgi:hypothetical protein